MPARTWLPYVSSSSSTPTFLDGCTNGLQQMPEGPGLGSSAGTDIRCSWKALLQAVESPRRDLSIWHESCSPGTLAS